MAYPAYKQYIPSRLEWLNVIPKHWEITRLRLLSKRYAGGTPSKDNAEYWQDGDVPWLNSGAVNQGSITKPSAFITQLGLKESSAKWIPENAIIIALAGQGKTKGTTAYTTFKVTCNQSMGAVIFEKDNPRFMYWWLVSQYRNIRGMASDDSRDGLNLEMIGTIPCPLPTIEEQTQIAKFLDHKTRQIDQLIEKKKALIEKLDEQRIAVITQAVTKGINENAKMKPSGVDWLGDVPEHWVIKRFKFSANLINIKVEAKGTNLPYMGMENIESFTARKIYDDENPSQSDGVGSYFSKNNVLFGKLRPYLAKAYLCNEEGFCSSELLVLEAADIHPNYLVKLVLSNWFVEMINSSTYGAKMPRASWDYIGNLICPIPAKDEQLEIASFISKETERIDQMKKLNVRTIKKLEEYRSALITSAVTGKIDVRNIKIPQGK